MRLAVVSDLHLGAGNDLDRFARVEGGQAFLRERLEAWDQTHDRVVLLGDIFETLRGWRPGSSRRELRAILDTYPCIADRLSSDRYVLVEGNHDPASVKQLGAVERWRLTDGGHDYMFLHGHQFDWEHRYAPLSQSAVWLGSLLERVRIPVTQTVDRFRKRPRYAEDEVTEREARALAFASAEGVDVVVTGHTHRAVRHEQDGVVYLNSGSWLTGRFTWVDLDTDTKSYRVVVDSPFGNN